MSPIDKKLARALHDAPKLVTATVALMEKLASILIKEIDVVTHRKTIEHVDLLKEKQRIAMDYRANMKSLAAQPEILKKLSEDAKDAVREMAQRLALAVEENARMLRAAVEATRQLIQNVMAMVRSEMMPKNTYKNSAKAHLELGNYSPTCQSVAVSRTV
jgi:hypothetical protein